MSACYSGLADRSPLPGDDLFGMQRALLRAGARTVVSGLWDVYDGTGPELMQEFFQQLSAGRPVPTALANSQRALLNRLRCSQQVEPWLHPYFWAVYTSAGDDRARLAVEPK
jgi:CHAT domain-containing protein